MSVFTRLLLGQGNKIIVFDVNSSKSQKLAKKYKVDYVTSVSQASKTDLILICAPTERIPGIINALKPYVRKGTIISEIASFKNETVPALKQFTGIKTLSIHPLFGPDITTLRDETIAVITVKDPAKELALAKSIFYDSKLVRLDPDTHDQCMASILSLPYFMNIAFSSVISEKNLPLLKELAGPTFEVQMAVTQSVIGETPDLINSLINDNVYSWSTIQEFLNEANRLKDLLKSGANTVVPFIKKLNISVGGKAELDSARKQRNKILKSIKREKE